MSFKRATDVLTESCKHELISPTTLESLEPLPRLLDRSVKVCRDCRIPRFDGEQASNFRISAVMTTFSNPKGCVTVPGIGGCLLNSNPKFVEIQKTSTSDSYHSKRTAESPELSKFEDIVGLKSLVGFCRGPLFCHAQLNHLLGNLLS